MKRIWGRRVCLWQRCTSIKIPSIQSQSWMTKDFSWLEHAMIARYKFGKFKTLRRMSHLAPPIAFQLKTCRSTRFKWSIARNKWLWLALKASRSTILSASFSIFLQIQRWVKEAPLALYVDATLKRTSQWSTYANQTMKLRVAWTFCRRIRMVITCCAPRPKKVPFSCMTCAPSLTSSSKTIWLGASEGLLRRCAPIQHIHISLRWARSEDISWYMI